MHDNERAPDVMSNSLQIALQRRRGCWSLQSWVATETRETYATEFAGAALPSSTGSTADGAVHILCLAPGEWLAVSDADEALEEHLRVWSLTRRSGGVAAVNVTDAFAVIRIKGRHSRAVLSRGCGLDLHPTQFPPAACARTLFAKIALIVDCIGPECFDLYLGRSYQAYLHAWLTDAASFIHLES
jgi:sarcosine oxidase subunit gamma